VNVNKIGKVSNVILPNALEFLEMILKCVMGTEIVLISINAIVKSVGEVMNVALQ